MRFLRRNIYPLLFCAVLLLSAVLVLRQFLANLSAHAQRREDFIALHQNGHTKPAEHLYQVLIQTFPRLSDSALWEDAWRTGMLINTNAPQRQSLIWQYHFAVRNELAHRTQRRLARLVPSSDL